MFFHHLSILKWSIYVIFYCILVYYWIISYSCKTCKILFVYFLNKLGIWILRGKKSRMFRLRKLVNVRIIYQIFLDAFKTFQFLVNRVSLSKPIRWATISDLSPIIFSFKLTKLTLNSFSAVNFKSFKIFGTFNLTQIIESTSIEDTSILSLETIIEH